MLSLPAPHHSIRSDFLLLVVYSVSVPLSSSRRGDSRVFHIAHLPSLPCKDDRSAVTQFDTADMSAFPHRRQCRKQTAVTVMTLDEHFANQRTDTEITVDLKRRTNIEEIRIDRILKHETNTVVCGFSITETSIAQTGPNICPAVDTAAFVYAVIQRFACSII